MNKNIKLNDSSIDKKIYRFFICQCLQKIVVIEIILFSLFAIQKNSDNIIIIFMFNVF
jgi:hypothetical protein